MGADERARSDLDNRFATLRKRLEDPDFLRNRGLGNEVGIYTLCYDPSLELDVRDRVRALKADGSLACRVCEHNLYDILLARLEQRRVLSRMPAMELKHSREWVVEQVDKVCDAHVFAEKIAEPTRKPGDVVLITGVGEVYPFLRLHDLLENIQPLVRDVPIVACYPGRFDGRTLRLFGRLEDENYYRAFDLV